VNTARRSILKLMPLAGVALPASKLLGDEAAADVEVKAVTPPEERNHKPLMVLRLKHPASHELIETLRKQLRSSLDHFGFAYIPAIVLPAYVELDVYSIPEGAEICSDLEPSKSV
jgi:hypothetical protein